MPVSFYLSEGAHVTDSVQSWTPDLFWRFRRRKKILLHLPGIKPKLFRRPASSLVIYTAYATPTARMLSINAFFSQKYL